jgi:hypothetical protein
MGDIFDENKLYKVSSYDWLFVTLIIKEVKQGQSIILKDEKFKKYFQGLSKWNCEVKVLEGNIRQDRFYHEPIARNKSEKDIAVKIINRFSKPKGGCVYFLPSLNEYSTYDSVEILLDIVFKEKKESEYPWRDRVEIPGLLEIKKEIDEYRKQVNDIEKK